MFVELFVLTDILFRVNFPFYLSFYTPKD